jgi:hypothetical protein
MVDRAAQLATIMFSFAASGAAWASFGCAARHHPASTRTAPTAQVPALLPRLDRHRRPHPDAGPGHLPLRRQPQHRHRLLVMLGVVVDPAACLRHPQLDAVMLEQRRHQRVLGHRRTPARTRRPRSRPSPGPGPPGQRPPPPPASAAPTPPTGSPRNRRTPPRTTHGLGNTPVTALPGARPSPGGSAGDTQAD